ncbi:HAD family hydrolase [Paenibacillus sp. J2TS4]|uniref:HAD family hydrolase n=1 Tax=Paenibacillus sp. J2TS4 TaxID=2807194 RepID=UPI001AFF4CA7|nr:HAD family hydrolase [Paenibacillus sp. J2TS4]GIP35865.1 haloacid dehalogenase [Paenibacillus sp. J2TS4]
MTKQTLLFDLDDTLIHCNKYFQSIIDQFADQLELWFKDYGLAAEEIKQKQLEIDISGVTRNGFTDEHFPQSLVDTYSHFAAVYGRLSSPKEMDWLRELGWSVYDQEAEPYPYMQETLAELQTDGHLLCLYTGGVPAIQQKKVKQVGIGPFFENRMFVRQHKNTEALNGILKSSQFDRKQTWMIGNSMRTDVLPALEAGIHSIYLPAPNDWSFNVVEVETKPQGAFLTLSSLREIRYAIQEYTK